ncbi:hypothetical protein A45J_1002 [hot springs metagenome]|uniref:CheW-like domain-containing protein n=1 Tax=hot springs metagenome TaxID=433727 RepID=A0A5J4L6T3_9ZZZZ
MFDNELQYLSILVFTVSGVKMGIDTEQIIEMLDMQIAQESSANIKKLDEIIPFGKRAVSFIRPKAIRLKASEMPLIIIEDPEDILDVNIADIRPMPFIIKMLGSRAVWGAVLTDSGIILLVDFYRLKKTA